MSSAFEDIPVTDIVRLVEENPLAWIVPSSDPSAAVLMPVLMEMDSSNTPVSLLGHLPRAMATIRSLQEVPAATVFFLGPNAYIPPGWVSKTGWAPTWNFVSLKVTGKVQMDDGLTKEAVTRLVDHMERPSGSDWTVKNIGGRFDTLLDQIIGFRLQIEEMIPRFKVGQDENEQSLQEIYAALDGHPLQRWMK